MSNIKIKASQVSNLTDARYFAALGVDYLGFKLDLSHEDRLSEALFHGIKEWVEGPKIVAEIGKTPLDLIHEVFSAEDYDILQCASPNISSDQITELTIDNLDDLNSCLPSEIYLPDFSPFREMDLYAKKDELKDLCNRFKLILPAPADKKHLDLLLHDIVPFGIEVKGSMEEKVGFKSFDDLDEFFEMYENV